MLRATARLTKMQKNVSYSVILKNKRAAFCLFTVIAAQSFAVEPFLSKELKAVGYPKWSPGLIFALWAFMYTLMAFLVAPLAKRFSTKLVSLSSYIIIAMGCFIFGPVSVINNSMIPADVQLQYFNGTNNRTFTCLEYGSPAHFPFEYPECDSYFLKRRILVIVGLIVLGTGMGTVVVPILVELVTAIKEKMGNVSK